MHMINPKKHYCQLVAMNQGTQKKNFTSMSTIILVDKVYLILFEMCHA